MPFVRSEGISLNFQGAISRESAFPLLFLTAPSSFPVFTNRVYWSILPHSWYLSRGGDQACSVHHCCASCAHGWVRVSAWQIPKDEGPWSPVTAQPTLGVREARPPAVPGHASLTHTLPMVKPLVGESWPASVTWIRADFFVKPLLSVRLGGCETSEEGMM